MVLNDISEMVTLSFLLDAENQGHRCLSAGIESKVCWMKSSCVVILYVRICCLFIGPSAINMNQKYIIGSRFFCRADPSMKHLTFAFWLSDLVPK